MVSSRGVGAGMLVAAVVLSAGESTADELVAPAPEPVGPAAESQPPAPAPSTGAAPAPTTPAPDSQPAAPSTGTAATPAPATPTPDSQPAAPAPGTAATPAPATPTPDSQPAAPGGSNGASPARPPLQAPPTPAASAYYAALPTLVPVHIYGKPAHTQYRLDPVVLWPGALKGECVGNCSLQLHPGSYKLTVEGTDLVTGSRKIEIPGPSRLEVEPRTRGQRTTGLVLGILGSALVLAGYVMIIASTGDGSDSDHGALLGTGVLSFLGGAVMTPIGWVKFGRSAPRVTVEPLY